MPLHIFKSGTHTDMHGTTLPFTPADLAACAAAYDPAVHEAPIVVGHPKTDDPAYGWVASLSATGSDLLAEPAQVDPQFAELVTAGRYKKISASFYLPDSPNNPKPGVLYLRHVGFLGAQPPSIKGLRSAAFGEQETGVVEFADWGLMTSASLFSRLRDFIISKFGLEDADAVLPPWQLDALRDEANRDDAKDPPAAFSEPPHLPSNEDSTVTEDEIKAMQAENARLKADAEARAKADAQRRQETVHTSNAAFAETLVANGTLAPAAQSVVVALLDAVSTGDQPVEFSEGDVTRPLATAFKDLLSGATPVLLFGERATKVRVQSNNDEPVEAEFAEADPARLALHNKAKALAKAEGISYDAAVARCL
ncbi:peptidase [Dickeya oryzae]|uniref:peptidase n=1 Tax=Dickeya oryzae TaxID=1240404 RepID=UPI001AEC7C0C|nr:peptidase [Dickeya oryzae]MBP2844458.1 peptidase [Dickeya oryzae]MBP2848750.1 peptidase [Dickeya oryzae]